MPAFCGHVFSGESLHFGLIKQHAESSVACLRGQKLIKNSQDCGGKETKASGSLIYKLLSPGHPVSTVFFFPVLLCASSCSLHPLVLVSVGRGQGKCNKKF